MSVLCVGQLVADVVVRPVDSLPERGTTRRVEDLRLVAGGCAANTASVLAKLGEDISVVGVLGQDALGDAVLDDLVSTGVDVSNVIRDPSTPTSAVIVMVHENGERSFLYREGGNERLTYGAISEEAIRRSDFVHIGGAMKLLSLDIAALLGRAKDFGCVTSLDTDWDVSDRWLKTLEKAFPRIDCLLTNEEEGRMLTGLDDPREIGKNLLDRGPRVVVVKRGPLGAIAVTDSMTEEYPAYKVPVVDTTCAGDAFAAGFLFGLSQGWDLPATVTFANATGALCATQISHSGIASLEETMEFLSQQVGEDRAREMFPLRCDHLAGGVLGAEL